MTDKENIPFNKENECSVFSRFGAYLHNQNIAYFKNSIVQPHCYIKLQKDQLKNKNAYITKGQRHSVVSVLLFRASLHSLSYLF